jgi:hypothetical protein
MITLTASVDLISHQNIESITPNIQGDTTTENYYVGSKNSNSDGKFTPAYIFTIKVSEPLNFLTVAFDTKNMLHPTKVTLRWVDSSGTTLTKDFYDDDSIYTMKIDVKEATKYELVISDWNAPNSPLIISDIYTEIILDINKRNLIDLNSSIFDRSDYKFPRYGIISNNGSMVFVDTTGEIKDYAEMLLLKSDLKVSINLNDTISKRTQQVGLFETREWDYDNDNRVVSVSLKDNLEEWQDINIDGFGFDPRNASKVLPNRSMADLYKWLHERTPSKYNMLFYDELDETTKQILENTIMEYPLLKKATLWRQWQKVCEACALYIFKNSVGKTVCVYTNGS